VGLLSLFAAQKHKNNKLAYYLRCAARAAVPRALCQAQLPGRLAALARFDEREVRRRVDYYNKLSPGACRPEALAPQRRSLVPPRPRVYHLDAYEYLRFFPAEARVDVLLGDITHVPDRPSLTKSRPIGDHNANSVLLNLDKVRHFMFVEDRRPFRDKRDRLVGRAAVEQPHRKRFLERWYGHPLCDVGQVNRNENSHRWQVGRLTIDQHLEYKFILCLEGNDVATNLKWVMSSGSLAVMPRPRFESWFMEGTLIPDHHYVAIRDDHADLEERLRHFIDHPAEAQAIVANANAYVARFRDRALEDLVSLLVLQKYFEMTGQGPAAALGSAPQASTSR